MKSILLVVLLAFTGAFAASAQTRVVIRPVPVAVRPAVVVAPAVPVVVATPVSPVIVRPAAVVVRPAIRRRVVVVRR
ncbi:hypothetical protein GA0116948_110157 [Chitinophaga costaii]|uniref:Uncharacterized protein n=2 Tax=Chitinophaga costaii TaxID=1335309 RepID=A0A1C4EZQ7_9BACT|nr:hypothetical protein GA0116948_110157 [Chitinophaga costaii]